MSNLFLRHGEVQNEKDVFYANLPGFYLSNKGETQAKDAGIKIIGLFEANNVVEAKLFPYPFENFAIVLAVAGQTTIKSLSLDKLI